MDALLFAAVGALAGFGFCEGVFQVLTWQRRRQARRYAQAAIAEMQRERARLEAEAMCKQNEMARYRMEALLFEQRRAR